MKKEGCLFLPVFFVGVFLANLLKYKTGDLCRILNIWILEQFAYSSISPERLFWQLLWKRGKFAFFFFLFGEGCGYAVASTVWLCLLTGTFGFFLAMAIADLGIRGVAVAFVGLLPQAFFYVAAVLWCRFCGKNSRQYRPPVCNPKIRIKQAVESVVFYGVAVILIIGGVFAEAYINIPLLKMIVKNF